MENNYFATLHNINVNDKVEQKNGLSYLSWAWAWAEVKKLHPDASYRIYENADGWFYHHDERTAWVKTGVTINGVEHIEYLPVMDHRNRSIPMENITSFDVNKAVQRSLTKAVARHGLGLYIYAGEDLPEAGREDEIKRCEEVRLYILELANGKAAQVDAMVAKYYKGKTLDTLSYAELLGFKAQIEEFIASRKEQK
jgi:hypothetical protein